MVIINQDSDVGAIPDAASHRDELFMRNGFPTWQGEAPFTGRKALFWRLAGCNKGSKVGMCDFCDTDFLMSKGFWLSFEQIIQASLEAYHGFGAFDLIVITGGEPLIQREPLVRLIALLQAAFPSVMVQIETNGDYLLKYFDLIKEFNRGAPFDFSRHWVVCSPKLRRSGIYEVPEGLTEHPLSRYVDLRCVISGDPTSPYHFLPDGVGDMKRVWVSPMTIYRRPPKEGEIASFWNDDLIDRDATRLSYERAKQLASLFSASRPIGLSLQSHLLYAVE